jgi:hypothetical protein
MRGRSRGGGRLSECHAVRAVLVAPKYCGDDDGVQMHVALEEIANSRALNDIPVPRRYAHIFTEIPG